MMRRLFPLLALVALSSSVLPAQSPATQEADRAGVTAAALDYIEGFYTGTPARMERALHPDLAKRIMRIDASGKATLEHMGASTLVGATRARQGVTPPQV